MASARLPVKPTILIVEDEPLLRLHAVDVIEDAGFPTLDVGNADDAIELLVSRADIRIVFTDIDMPGSMDGIKLAAAIARRWPPVSVIITSGFRVPQPDELPTRGIFLPKPYDGRELTSALHRLSGV